MTACKGLGQPATEQVSGGPGRQVGKPFIPYRLFNGIFIPERILQYAGLSPAAKLCYGALSRFAGKNGRCWPSQDQLAAALGGVSVRTVRRNLQELESQRLIRVVQIGLQRHNEYEFLWHEIFFGSERTDLASPDRTTTSSPDQTRSSAPSITESLEESTNTETALYTTSPSLPAGQTRPKSLSQISLEDAAPFLAGLRASERRKLIG
jgi:hypothetical protein